MVHTIIGAMSLAGTTVIILYLLLYFLARKCLLTQWRYKVLKISLFFFLFPVGLFKYDIEMLVKLIVPSIKTWSSVKEIDYSNTIMRNGMDIFIPYALKIKWIIFSVAGIIAVSIIVAQICEYFKMKSMLFNLDTIQNEVVFSNIKTYKKNLNIKSIVKIIITDMVKIPSTLGVIRPVIFLPRRMVDELDQCDLELIINHELLHIKHKDLLVKFIALFALAVNWFNPVLYFVFYEICNMSEVYCDAESIKGKNEDTVKRYCNLLIEIASSEKYTLRNRWSSGLVNNDMKMIKRRILEMKNRKKGHKIVSLCATGIILLAGTSTVFAYDAPKQVVGQTEDFDVANVDENNKDDWATISEESRVEEIPYDNFFTYSDGATVEVRSDSSSSENVRHTHSWADGVYTSHRASGKGCIVDKYQAKYCTVCGNVNILYKISTTSYTVCNH